MVRGAAFFCVRLRHEIGRFRTRCVRRVTGVTGGGAVRTRGVPKYGIVCTDMGNHSKGRVGAVVGLQVYVVKGLVFGANGYEPAIAVATGCVSDGLMG